MRCKHRYRFIEWIVPREIGLFYCVKCLNYEIKWSDYPLSSRRVKAKFKKLCKDWYDKKPRFKKKK